MKVLLGVSGSVSASLADKIIFKLEQSGHEVRSISTFSALYFWKTGFRCYLFSMFFSKIFYFFLTRKMIERLDQKRKIWTDFDEWRGFRYKKNMPVGHIELREWADVLLIAPLSADALAKTANGLADDLLTSVFRAWNQQKPIVLAPAMNTVMWNSAFTAKHLETLNSMFKIRVVGPVAKKLACGAEGIGALANIDDIVGAVNSVK